MPGTLKLNSGGAGNLILTPSGSVGSDVTVTVPAVTGTVVSTGSTGQVSQAMLATNVAGTGPAFAAYCNNSQSLANNTLAVMQCGAEDFDTNSCYNNSTYTFTPNVAGYYMFYATASFSPNGGGECYAYVFKNTSGYLLYDIQPTNFWALGGSVLLYANGTTDYFQFKFIQGTGSSKTMNAETRFQGFMVRGA